MPTPKQDTLSRTHSLKARGDSMITPEQLAELQLSVPDGAKVTFRANTSPTGGSPVWFWAAEWDHATHQTWQQALERHRDSTMAQDAGRATTTARVLGL